MYCRHSLWHDIVLRVALRVIIQHALVPYSTGNYCRSVHYMFKFSDNPLSYVYCDLIPLLKLSVLVLRRIEIHVHLCCTKRYLMYIYMEIHVHSTLA